MLVMKTRALIAVLLLSAILPTSAQADYPHVVAPGESLTSIAATDGLTINALAQANGLSPNAQLLIGQILQIPPQTANPSAPGPTPAATPAARPSSSPTVEPATATDDGDNDADDIASHAAGPNAPSVNQAPTPPAPSPAPQPPASQAVTGALINQIASQYGVPGPFAQAIAWQESGWNNAAVSPAGALGVMQILPSTWNWINTFLIPSVPLQSGSATDNVRAGVILLHSLLVATGGSESQAAAAYYQGLSSLQSFGAFPSTRQYVANVMALTHRFGG